ncbi:Zinc finger BED domain-containing protein RICESLEEPER 2 [Bienertia sinuspersici]
MLKMREGITHRITMHKHPFTTDNFASNNGRLLCNGKFHVRCCAHILNIIVQHGLEQVKHITDKVDDTVDYLNSSEVRLKRFGELVSQYNLKERKLALLCKTRWNSTYDMLDCAIKFTKLMSGKNLKNFDTYWSECNMVMALGSLLDPRFKMKVIKVTFPQLFASHNVNDNINKVRDVCINFIVNM